MRLIESQHAGESIQISGFEVADESVHMLEWLRRGRDFRQFVVGDIERELYAQDAHSQLLSVECKAAPEFETTAKTDQLRRHGIVSRFSVVFPLSLRVRAGNGEVWRLAVAHGYRANGLDVPDEFKLASSDRPQAKRHPSTSMHARAQLSLQ